MPSRTIRNAALVSLLFAAAPWAPRATAADTPKAASTAEVKAMPSKGAWMNAPLEFKGLGDDAFSITASEKTDFYNPVDGSPRAANAPMLLFPADETFVLTTAVKVDFKAEFDGGFLVVYSDADHWLKLLFEKSHYGPFSVCSSVTNDGTDDTVNADVPKNEVFLRITRAKDIFGFYYSVDGTTWNYIRYFRFPVKGPLKVGFASQSPTGERCTTVFSKVSYAPAAVRDFWSGEPETKPAAKGD